MSVRRDKTRLGLHPFYLPGYDALCSLLGPQWDPCSGARSREEQATLFAQGRTLPGPIVTRAKPGMSAHNWGCASDWCLWDGSRALWPATSDPLWQDYIHAIEKVGLRPGAEFNDFPHNELAITVRWSQVEAEFLKNGTQAAYRLIDSKRA